MILPRWRVTKISRIPGGMNSAGKSTASVLNPLKRDLMKDKTQHSSANGEEKRLIVTYTAMPRVEMILSPTVSLVVSSRAKTDISAV